MPMNKDLQTRHVAARLSEEKKKGGKKLVCTEDGSASTIKEWVDNAG